MLWETYLSWALCPVGAGCWVRGRIYNQLVRMNHRAPQDSRNRGTVEEEVGQKIMQAFLSKEVDGDNMCYSCCDCLGFYFYICF